MYERILCPIDGSPTSHRGLQEAIALALDRKATLRIVHVVDLQPALSGYGGMGVPAEVLDSMRRGGAEALSKARDEARSRGVDIEDQLAESTVGRVAEVIVQAARDWKADLLVVGTHGRRGVSHLFLGSDAEAIARLSPVPVLLVRATEAAAP